jgi:hypothetical protein
MQCPRIRIGTSASPAANLSLAMEGCASGISMSNAAVKGQETANRPNMLARAVARRRATQPSRVGNPFNSRSLPSRRKRLMEDMTTGHKQAHPEDNALLHTNSEAHAV